MAETTLDAVAPNEPAVQAFAVQPPAATEITEGTPAPVAPAGLPVQPDVPLGEAVSMPSAEGAGESRLAAINRNAITYSDTNLEAAQKYAASLASSAKAQASQWSGVGAYEKAIMPKFVPDADFDLAGRISAVPMQLDADEEKFLRSASNAEFDYKLGLIEKDRAAREKVGNHPVLGFAVGVLDPVQIGIDILSSGAGRLYTGPRLIGRTIAAATAVGATAGVGYLDQQGRVMSDTEIVFNALINGAAAGVFYGRGPNAKLSTPDPMYKELGDTIAGLNPQVPSIGTRWIPSTDANNIMLVDLKTGKPILKQVQDEVPFPDSRLGARQIPRIIDESNKIDLPDVPVQTTGKTKYNKTEAGNVKLAATGTARSELSAVAANSTDPTARVFAQKFLDRLGGLADNLQVVRSEKVTRAFFDPSTNTVYLGKNTPDRIVNHEMAHAMTHYKAKYGKANPDSAHGQIVTELESLRKQARKGMKSQDDTVQYYLKNLDEFMAGLYSGHAPFIKHLAKLRDTSVPGKVSMLSSMVDAVRRLLGISPDAEDGFLRALNLVEQLQDLPLEVKLMNQKAMRGANNFLYESTTSATKKAGATETLYRGIKKLGQRDENGVVFATPDSKVAQRYAGKTGKVLEIVDSGDKRLDLSDLGSTPKEEDAWRTLKGVVGENVADDILMNIKSTNTEGRFDLYKLFRESAVIQKLRELDIDSVVFNQVGEGGDYITIALLNEAKLAVRNTQSSQIADDLLYAPPTAATPPAQTGAYVAKELDTLWKKVGHSISWNLSKTMSKLDAAISRRLVDNPTDPSGDSAASFQRSIRAELAAHQYNYENALKDEMAVRGAGSLSRIATPGKAMQVQAAIEKEVQVEMLARQERARLGMDTKPPGMRETPITKMADHMQEIADASLKELKSAGVLGSEALDIVAGYFSRQWNPAKLADAMDSFKRVNGMDDAAAKAAIRDLMQEGIKRANGWDDKISRNVASAIIDRTLRKGELSDNAFRGHIGNAGVAELRDDLARAGVTGKDAQDILDKMTGAADEANKASFLKHRVEMDTSVRVALQDGRTIALSDLIDSNMSNITERYLDNVAGRAAMARVGLRTEGDVAKMRTQFVSKATTEAAKKEAAELFDNVIDAIMGRPLGKDMNDAFRFMQAGTQMVGLGLSGVWQVTEYAAILQKFGLAKTLGYFMREMPGFRNLFDSALENQDSVASILTRNSFQDIRMRPFISKLEDNYDIEPSAFVMHAMQQAKQWVPYLNGMRVVHHHQARMTGNLIADTLVRGANGDAKALLALEKYGLDRQLMDKVRADIKQFGQDTSKWSDGTWDAIRNPLNRMVDDAVLRSRTGEMPAFAQFSEVGKFIFTFRSFVLAAHNKILAGTLSRDGLAGISLLLAYQFPLTLAAVQAEHMMRGKGKMSDEDWVKRAIAQMGGLGLFTEIFGAVVGDKTKFGAPGTLLLDKAYNVLNSVGRDARDWYKTGDLNVGGTTGALVGATPILSIIPGIKALTEALVPRD